MMAVGCFVLTAPDSPAEAVVLAASRHAALDESHVILREIASAHLDGPAWEWSLTDDAPGLIADDVVAFHEDESGRLRAEGHPQHRCGVVFELEGRWVVTTPDCGEEPDDQIQMALGGAGGVL